MGGRFRKNSSQAYRSYRAKASTQFTTYLTSWKKRIALDTSINSVDILLFLKQLSMMLSAAIPLGQALTLLVTCQEKPLLRTLIFNITQDLEAGKNFSHSLATYPIYFDALTRQLIQIGEQLGQLEAVLPILINYLDKQRVLKKKITAALCYPAIIITTAITVIVSLLFFVIPRFIELFHYKQVNLPLLTRGIFFISIQLRQHLLFLVLISLIIACALRYPCRWTNYCRVHCQQYLLTSLPIIKQYAKQITLAHFTRQLAISLAGGISLTDALALLIANNKQSDFKKLLDKIHVQILTGLSLNQAMLTVNYFPSLMVKMIKVGEESGRLTSLLDSLANEFDETLATRLNQLSHFIEPLIILILGVLIGGLVIGMYLPVFHIGLVI